jgi:hypothetical protein
VEGMKNYPYVLSKKRLVEFITKIPRMGIPSKIDKQWLIQAGFPTENDERFLTVLKYLDLIDNSGSPRDNYKNYRGDKAKSVLATIIKTAFTDLFEMHPNANQLSENELHDYFTGVSGTGSITVDRMVMTFRALCENSDFNGSSNQIKGIENIIIKHHQSGSTSSISDENIAATLSPEPVKGATVNPAINYSSMTPIININIQLSLPDTKDSEVYDNFFAAMRKHLFR